MFMCLGLSICSLLNISNISKLDVPGYEEELVVVMHKSFLQSELGKRYDF